MSSKYGFDKANVAPLHSSSVQQTPVVSRIDPVITDILNDVLQTFGNPHQDCVRYEPINTDELVGVWTAPNIALVYPDERQPLIVTLKHVNKRRFFSTVHVLRLELLWGNNQRITEEHHPPLFQIAAVVRDKTDISVAVMSWCDTESARDMDRFSEEKVFDIQGE